MFFRLLIYFRFKKTISARLSSLTKVYWPLQCTDTSICSEVESSQCKNSSCIVFVFPGGCREDQWGSLCGLWDHPVLLGVAAHQSGGVVLPSPAAQSEPGESLIMSHSSKSVHQYHSWTLTQ